MGQELGMRRFQPVVQLDVENPAAFAAGVDAWIATFSFLCSGLPTGDFLAARRAPPGVLGAHEHRPIRLVSRVEIDEGLLLLRFEGPNHSLRPGDHVVIMPENSPADVSAALKLLHLSDADTRRLAPDDVVIVDHLPCPGLVSQQQQQQQQQQPVPPGLTELATGAQGLAMTVETLLRKYAGDLRGQPLQGPLSLGKLLDSAALTSGRTYTVASFRPSTFDLLVSSRQASAASAHWRPFRSGGHWQLASTGSPTTATAAAPSLWWAPGRALHWLLVF
jgi:hypothetical protein